MVSFRTEKEEGLLLASFLLSIYVVFVAYLTFPELETFFGLYANGSLWFALGMAAKGHNYGECRKCGAVHAHIDRHGKNNSMYCKHHTEETKRKIHESKKGIPVNKGKHYNITPEDREARRKRIREIVKKPETRAKISSALAGRPSPKKGIKLTVLHRLRIAVGLRKSEFFF